MDDKKNNKEKPYKQQLTHTIKPNSFLKTNVKRKVK